MADHPGGHKEPVAQAANRHGLQPAQLALEEHDQVVRQHPQGQRRLGRPKRLTGQLG